MNFKSTFLTQPQHSRLDSTTKNTLITAHNPQQPYIIEPHTTKNNPTSNMNMALSIPTSALFLLTPTSVSAAARGINRDDDSRCRLLELAAELRNRIYEEALAGHTFKFHGRTAESVKSEFHDHPLLLSCKQIRAEAQDMYFSLSIFWFDCSPVVDYKLGQLHRSLLKVVTKIDIDPHAHVKWAKPDPEDGWTANVLDDPYDIEPAASNSQQNVMRARSRLRSGRAQISPDLVIRESVHIRHDLTFWSEHPYVTCFKLLSSPKVALDTDTFEHEGKLLCQTMGTRLSYWEFDHYDKARCWDEFAPWTHPNCGCPKKASGWLESIEEEPMGT